MEQREFLRKKLLKQTREQINEKFAGREIHIIKAVNLLSDLDSINNLMKENTLEWKVRQPTGEAQNAFSELEKNTQSIEEEKKSLMNFIEKEMNAEFPNFSALATPVLGAKLLASAGSKKRLCFMPASTIQLLGAEKALFAHLRKHAKSPKHGHIFNHPLMQKLPRFKRGKAARLLAGKLSIALKQDYFNGENTSEEILKELEQKINAIAAEPVTPKQEQHEQEYDQIQQERFNEQKRKTETRNNFSRERNSFQKESGPNQWQENGPRQWQQRSAQSRGGTFNSSSQRDSFGSLPRFGGQQTGERRYGHTNFKKRRPMINKNYGQTEGPYGEQSFSPRENRFSGQAYRTRDNEISHGHERTKNNSFGKGRFNKPKHSHKRY
ncbi:MAG: hypothetical protein WC462_00205 [archaeon]